MERPENKMTIAPLPRILQDGLPVISTFALISLTSTILLFCWLTYKIWTGRVRNRSDGRTSQFILLVCNLMLADIQQAIGFSMNLHSLSQNAIIGGSTSCSLQAWFISVGDLSSSLFILAIALHTYLALVHNYRPRTWVFHLAVGGLWTFNYVVAAIPLILHIKNLYAPAGPWCWISEQYGSARLWTHYIYILVCIVVTFAIYLAIYVSVYLKHHIKGDLARSKTLHLLVLYPLSYTMCIAPLALGRLASMRHNGVSMTYWVVAGSMVACNGWMDVLLYTGTRRGVVFGEPADDQGMKTFLFGGPGFRKEKVLGTVTSISGGKPTVTECEAGPLRAGSQSRATRSWKRWQPHRSSSLESLRPGIQLVQTIEVQLEDAPEDLEEGQLEMEVYDESRFSGFYESEKLDVNVLYDDRTTDVGDENLFREYPRHNT